MVCFLFKSLKKEEPLHYTAAFALPQKYCWKYHGMDHVSGKL